MKRSLRFLLLGCICALAAGTVLAADVTLKDPTGDDFGPGGYSYPTDAVYTRGSFDMTGLQIKSNDKKVDFMLSVKSNLEDPWSMGNGFAVQMAFVYIDTTPGAGHTKGLPGQNVMFAEDQAWDKVVILSPQQPGRVKQEVDSKAGEMKDGCVIPNKTRGSSRTISASVDLAALGAASADDVKNWGYQVVMQSNEGFPTEGDLLTRKVNEYEGQHRFGGGNDGECDPHVIDVFAGMAKGDKSEIDEQKKMLTFECADDGTSKAMATLTMVKAN